MAKNPYTLLGISKSASGAEVRKAYRALAKKLHPDVNPGDAKKADRFKEITAAYTLLSDKKLRKQYDSGAVDGSGQAKNPFAGGANPFGGRGRPNQGMGGGQDDMSHLFASLFGMNMGGQTGGNMRDHMRGQMGGQMGGQMRGQRGRPPQKGGDIRYKLSLGFVEALNGGKKAIIAGGEKLNVTIPKGVADGSVLRLRGKGQASANGGPSGDAKVEITVKSHKYFSRQGNTLRLTLPISLQEAVLGAKVRIPMPSGAVSLNIPAGSNGGKTLRLKGKGIKGGDLLITLQIVLTEPKSVDLQAWAKDNSAPESAALRDVLTL